jgi:hypothetical protein
MKKLRKLLAGLLLFTCWLFCSSHIGSPNIIFEGNAGEYKILVNIMPPEVVPGTATISVQAADPDVERVLVQAVYFRHGGDKAPDSEPLNKVKGDGGYYSGLLWLMAHGSSSVKVTVEGAKGTGSTVIPVPALATAQLAMDPALGIVLVILGVILFVGGATIIGASVGEGVTKPGESLTKSRKRRSIVVGIVSSFMLVGILKLGSMWWEAEEKTYERYMYRPIGLSATLEPGTGDSWDMVLKLDDIGHIDRKAGDLIPDHGKWMHVFMVGGSDAAYFAHVHPTRADSLTYIVNLPDLPVGDYQIFADIVHKTGLSETLLANINIPRRNPAIQMELTAQVESPFRDPEDTWYAFQQPVENVQTIGEGLQLHWEGEAKLVAGQVTSLRFSVTDSYGLPQVLEPYLGMLGHSVVMRDDASVFIHLHPIGTISMAAQEAIAGTISDDITLCLELEEGETFDMSSLGLLDQSQLSTMRTEMVRRMQEQGLSSEVSFPYAFPKPGNYRVWVQVKIKGKIHTGAFDIAIDENPLTT